MQILFIATGVSSIWFFYLYTAVSSQITNISNYFVRVILILIIFFPIKSNGTSQKRACSVTPPLLLHNNLSAPKDDLIWRLSRVPPSGTYPGEGEVGLPPKQRCTLQCKGRLRCGIDSQEGTLAKNDVPPTCLRRLWGSKFCVKLPKSKFKVKVSST